jgi:threonine aldolase
MRFASDNISGASDKVMAALVAANTGTSAAYGQDVETAQAAAQFSAIFDHPCSVFLLTSGTAANALALASLMQPWGAALTHLESHIANDECGAPEFYTSGAKIIGLPGTGAKLAPETVTAQLARMSATAVAQVQPQVLSISQATECGLVYQPAEIAALSAAIRPRGMKLHMDGARFANAIAALGCHPADMTWKAGVDMLSFGGTKNGAFAAEAVIVFDPDMAAELPWRRKRSGHTLSKGRFVGTQFNALLKDDHWLDLARHANAMAQRLAAGLTGINGIRLAWAVEANEVFVIMPTRTHQALQHAGSDHRVWTQQALSPDNALREGEIVARFVASFATQPAQVDALLAAFAQSD